MYGEHPNGGTIEVDSRNVNFLEDEFPNDGEIKQDLQLYELQLDNALSLSEEENLNPHQVTENSIPIENSIQVFKRDTENLSVLENQSERHVRF